MAGVTTALRNDSSSASSCRIVNAERSSGALRTSDKKKTRSRSARLSARSAERPTILPTSLVA